MGDSPRHSDRDGMQANRGAAGGTPRRPSLLGRILVIAIAAGLVALFVVLHLTGTIGPGAH